MFQALQNKSMLTLALGPGDVSIMSMPEEPGITWMKNKEIRSQMLHLRFGASEKRVFYLLYLPVADCISHVDVSIHAALNELHVVLCQGPRLVRENVLHLPARTTFMSYSFQLWLSSPLPAHLAQLFVQI